MLRFNARYSTGRKWSYLCSSGQRRDHGDQEIYLPSCSQWARTDVWPSTVSRRRGSSLCFADSVKLFFTSTRGCASSKKETVRLYFSHHRGLCTVRLRSTCSLKCACSVCKMDRSDEQHHYTCRNGWTLLQMCHVSHIALMQLHITAVGHYRLDIACRWWSNE